MIKYFTIEEKIVNKYKFELPDNFKGTPKEYAKKYDIEKLFENSLHEKIIKYIDSDINTIKELN